MPELPEVETIRRGLERLIVGKQFVGVHCYESPKSFPNSMADVQRFVIDARVTAVRRRAKVLMIDLDTDYSLVIHLKMTGQLIYIGRQTAIAEGTSHQASFRGRGDGGEFTSAPSGGVDPSFRWGGGHPNDSFLHELPDRSTRVELVFGDDSHLYFNDQRKFGWIKLYPTDEIVNIDFMQRVGPEPLGDSLPAALFISQIRRRNNTSVKAAILDQTVLAGVGNIYADESLWMTGLHPSTRVRDISDESLAALLGNIKAVLTLSIEQGGSTDKNYVDAEGKKGSYLKFANVFRREGQACPRCGAQIVKLRVAGRGTHICPTCQADPGVSV